MFLFGQNKERKSHSLPLIGSEEQKKKTAMQDLVRVLHKIAMQRSKMSKDFIEPMNI